MIKHQLPSLQENETKSMLCVDQSLVKRYEYAARIVRTSLVKEEDSIQQTKKIVIGPGNVLEFIGTDDNPILQIQVENTNLHVYPTEQIKLKGWPRRGFNQQMRLEFLDKQNDQQTVIFNVEDRYVEAIIKKMNEAPSKELHEPAPFDVEDVKSHGNILEARKIVILPIELMISVGLGSMLELRGKDDNAILRIPIENISQIYPTAQIVTNYWPRRVIDLRIQIHFTERQQDQTVIFNVEDRYVEAIIKKIRELKDVKKQEYWMKLIVPYGTGSQDTTIFPRSLYLGQGENILWKYEKLDVITGRGMVRLYAVTNFRVFDYDFEMHRCHCLILYEVDDIILDNMKSISSKEKEATNTETPNSGDLVFINHQKSEVRFSNICDPYKLRSLVRRARADYLQRLGKDYLSPSLIGKNISCTKCGHINLEGANFCHECHHELEESTISDSLAKTKK